jgi:hypothetical protein
MVAQGIFYELSGNSDMSGNQLGSKVEVRYEGETWFTRIWNSWLADVVNLLINVPLFIIGIAFTLYLTYLILSIPFKFIAGIVGMFSDKEQ